MKRFHVPTRSHYTVHVQSVKGSPQVDVFNEITTKVFEKTFGLYIFDIEEFVQLDEKFVFVRFDAQIFQPLLHQPLLLLAGYVL